MPLFKKLFLSSCLHLTDWQEVNSCSLKGSLFRMCLLPCQAQNSLYHLSWGPDRDAFHSISSDPVSQADDRFGSWKTGRVLHAAAPVDFHLVKWFFFFPCWFPRESITTGHVLFFSRKLKQREVDPTWLWHQDELERYLDAAPVSLWPDSEAGSDAAAEAPSISPWPWSRLREETPPGAERSEAAKRWV